MAPSPSSDQVVTSEDLDLLLDLAATAVVAATEGDDAPMPAVDELPASVQQPLGAFVTLTVHGRLNGCIGTIEPTEPLAAAVVRLALDAAFADPRLPALRPADLPGLAVEVSLLSPFEPLPAATRREVVDALRPGRDGLLLASGSRRAVFLPDVWEQLPDADAFVGQLLAKAGLPAAGWPPAVRAARFTTVRRRRALRDLRPGRPRPPRSAP